jgi:hypothetical protein
MFWIRKAGLAVLVAAALSVGCTHRENTPPMATVAPAVQDEAMQRRMWDQSTAMYPSGAVAAGPTEFNYEPKRYMVPEWRYWYADSFTFFGNMTLLPFNLIGHPQTQAVIYPGETVLPSYTAQPVMPPQAVVQPSTPPVIEGAEPTTPPVVEPGTTPATDNSTAPAPAPEATPTPPTEPAAQTAPATPQAAPAPEATPAPAPPTAAPIAPAPTPEPAPAPGEVAPSTPRVIEPPPSQATRNLAPAVHLTPATTQPDLNK